MNKDAEIPMLLDLYGNLLSDFQHQCLDYYYNSDLSLSEIADLVGKSRQGVFESIKRSESILINFESKLQFLKKFEKVKEDFLLIELLIKKLGQSESATKKSINMIHKIVKKYNSD